jgi:hypothetical protein
VNEGRGGEEIEYDGGGRGGRSVTTPRLNCYYRDAEERWCAWANGRRAATYVFVEFGMTNPNSNFYYWDVQGCGWIGVGGRGWAGGEGKNSDSRVC